MYCFVFIDSVIIINIIIILKCFFLSDLTIIGLQLGFARLQDDTDHRTVKRQAA